LEPLAEGLAAGDDRSVERRPDEMNECAAAARRETSMNENPKSEANSETKTTTADTNTTYERVGRVVCPRCGNDAGIRYNELVECWRSVIGVKDGGIHVGWHLERSEYHCGHNRYLECPCGRCWLVPLWARVSFEAPTATNSASGHRSRSWESGVLRAIRGLRKAALAAAAQDLNAQARVEAAFRRLVTRLAEATRVMNGARDADPGPPVEGSKRLDEVPR
jgi:hypothetical protein